jgi:hypothetical protein
MTAPLDCSKAPKGTALSCAMGPVDTGSKLVPKIIQCSRCGWVDPASLDAYAELGFKRSLSKIEQRTAMAIEGEPFTFVRSSEADVTLDEALGQALGAASMCWTNVEGAGRFKQHRAKQIFEQLKLLLQEKSKEDRAALVQEIVDNTQ